MTNFGLLLSGAEGKQDPCVSLHYERVLPWLSLAFVATAVICICLFVVLLEFKYQNQRAYRRSLITEIHRLTQSQMEQSLI